MPRIDTLMRALAYVVLVTLCVHLIISYAPGNDTDEADEISRVMKTPLAAELCQYLELRDVGVEGAVDKSQYTLKGVALVFRHGERSPLLVSEGATLFDCAPFRDRDRKSFEEFVKIIDSTQFKNFLKVDKQFEKYPRYPLRSECSAGNLTAEGALQLSRLGNHLRRAYEQAGLFSEDSRLDVKVVASPYRRTFQSAVALLSSFVFPLKGFVSKVSIDHSNYTFHCVDDFCACPSAVQWRLLYEKQHLAFFLNDTSSGVRARAQEIFGQIDATKRSAEPFSMLDILLGRFICRRHPLPCTKEGKCVSYELVNEMLAYTSGRGEAMFAAGPQTYIARRLLTAEAAAILEYVVRMAERLRGRRARVKEMKIFSGHDVTVGPLLRVLGVPFVDFPRYGSRIAFEVYEGRHGGDDFLRLVYNGEDRTSVLPFCEGTKLCRMSAFTQFVRSEMFESAGFSNGKELCDPSLNPQPK